MLWLCLLLTGLLAATWGVCAVRRRRRLREIERLHALAQAFLREGVPVPGSLSDDELAPLQEDLAALSGAAALARGNQRAHDEQVSRMMADISHQFKTPLSSLRLYAELEQDDGVSRADRMLLQIARMEELIRSLLRLERLRANAVELRFAPCDLATLARETAGQMAAIWPEKRFSLPEQPLPVRCDESWMREALTNVLRNACEHTAQDGSIRVETAVGAGTVWISVEDDGGGVPEEQLPLLFRRFGKIAAETGKGSGLGLAITRSILELHHGTAVASNGAAGLRVTLCLPAE